MAQTIEIPEGAIALIWCPEDVLDLRPDLSETQAAEVLEEVKRCHDASIGVNWDTIRYAADAKFPRAEASEDDQ